MEKIVFKSGKVAYVAEPYRPNRYLCGGFFGRDRELAMATAAWMRSKVSVPQSPLLVGEPGNGKNRLVYELSRQSGRPLFILQGHEDLTPEDIACSVRFSDDPSRQMDYVLSPLLTAMQLGGICFIDEIGKFRPKAVALLASVLDDRRYIDSNLLGERVVAKLGFRLIAATNSGEVGALPDFVQSRMRPIIEVGYPSMEEIDQLLVRALLEEDEVDTLISCFWSLWSKSKRCVSYRTANHHLALARGLCDVEGMTGNEKAKGNIEYALRSLDQESVYFPLAPRHLEAAFEQLIQEDAA